MFLFVVAAVYFCLIFGLDGLTGPAIWDEHSHWQASLFFRDRPFPTLQDLNNYGGLNTPLPFILFGALERWLGLGMAAGRWLNLILSLGIVFAVGWPRKLTPSKHIPSLTPVPTLLCLVGLLACPYFLFASARLYTEMIACFWMLAGYIAYVRKRHALSSVAFVLAIASRQYMLAFPMAIALYELVTVLFQAETVSTKDTSRASTLASKLAMLWPFLAALTAVLSIAGWIYVFGGLTPKTAIVHSIQSDSSSSWATTQQTIWSIRPGVALNYLAYVGLYLVIPEWLLFRTAGPRRKLRQHWRSLIAVSSLLLILFWLYPPLVKEHGILAKLVYNLPTDIAQMALLYGLALLSCLRFSRFEPVTLMVFFNGLIMMKAHPWDRYVLPMAVAFWYAKSAGLAEASSRFFSSCLTGRLAVWQHDGEGGSK